MLLMGRRKVGPVLLIQRPEPCARHGVRWEASSASAKAVAFAADSLMTLLLE
ncbi:MAG: hypothetical protein K0Q61_692 [Rhodococcus erythropolis]|jgi:hypothetical protein|nr:hypothetical protein [Rhodococcus erythropolis]